MTNLETVRVIGLMSGTSLDGIDAACIELNEASGAIRVLSFVSQPYDDATRAQLAALCENGRIEDATRMHFALGELFAEAALAAMREAQLAPRDVLCIGSHGQTICHLPPTLSTQQTGTLKTLGATLEAIGATLQIGSPAVIAERTGIAVVSDFRSRDMAAGGQGAPLVPFADFQLLRSDQVHRIAQNIGGIANLTWLPRGGALENVRAFDSGPGNMVMDELMRLISGGAQHFDKNGALASRGAVCEEWLAQEMTHLFFAAPPPKSTGREDFGRTFAARFYAAGKAQVLSDADILATATALCARSIVAAYRQVLPRDEPCEIVVSGGGARNATLMKMLHEECAAHFGAAVSFRAPEEFGFSSQAKEAVAFALLARATMRDLPSNVPSATGAAGARILGSITRA